jgi:hypothetical protein
MTGQGRDTEFQLKDVTAVFEPRHDYAEPLTASQITTELGCSRHTALNKLHRLEEDTDTVGCKSVPEFAGTLGEPTVCRTPSRQCPK